MVAAENRLHFTGQPHLAPQVLFDTFVYTFDADGNVVPVSDTNTDGFPATVSIAGTLESGSGSFSGAGTQCVYDAGGNATCSDVTVSIDASFTATGPITHQHSTEQFGTAGEFRVVFHGAGRDRLATGTATVLIDGSPVDLGTNTAADIGSGTDGVFEVCIPGGTCP